MSTPLSFLERLVVEHGGLVERSATGRTLNALLPPEVQAALELHEPMAELGADAEPEGTGSVLTVGFGSKLLERAVQLATRTGRSAAVQLVFPPSNKQASADLADHFAPINATYRLTGERDDVADYWVWSIAASIESDERHEVLVQVALSAQGSECPHVVELVQDRSRDWRSLPATEVRAASGTGSELRLAAFERALTRAHGDSADFHAGVQRRYERDRKRTVAYFAELRAEMDTEIQRRRLVGEAREVREQKQAQLAEEKARKLIALAEKYRIRVSLRPIVLVLARLPIKRCEVRILRRKGERQIAIAYNTAGKRYEPLVCEACGVGTLQPGFCDEALHVLCPACATKGTGRSGRDCPRCQGSRPAGSVAELIKRQGFVPVAGSVLTREA